jgi:hypothetical protein
MAEPSRARLDPMEIMLSLRVITKTRVDHLFRLVDWPAAPRSGDAIEVAEGFDGVEVDHMYFDYEGGIVVQMQIGSVDEPGIMTTADLQAAGWTLREPTAHST